MNKIQKKHNLNNQQGTHPLRKKCFLRIAEFLDTQSLSRMSQTCWHNYKTINNAKNLNLEERKIKYLANKKAEAEAIRAFNKINTNWEYPESEESKYKSPTKSWDFVDVQRSNKIFASLIWNQNEQPNLQNAIEEIINNKMKSDCLNSAMIVRLAIICKVLGKEATAHWVKETAGKKSINYKVMHKLSWSFVTPKKDIPEAIFAVPTLNIPEYQYFKPYGYDSNSNLIGLSNRKRIGFSPPLFKEGGPQTIEKVEEFLYKCFCENKHIKPRLEDEHKEFVKNLSFKKFQKKRRSFQSKYPYYEFNIAKMLDYKKNTK